MSSPAICGFAALFLAMSAGCGDSVTEPHVGQPHARSTQDAVVQQVAEAHRTRDIESYAECLHPDFQMTFAEVLPDTLDREDAIQFMRRVFEAQPPYVIRLQFSIRPADWNSGQWSSAAFDVDCSVVRDTGADQTDHWVTRHSKVSVLPDPENSGLWTIAQIEEMLQ